jgi:transforming growth factor-beta-induced protein
MRPTLIATVLCVPLLAASTLVQGADKNLLEAAAAESNLTTFVDLVKSSPGVKSAFAGPGPTTVFAPTDEAFAKLPKGALDALKANEDKREAALLSHCAGGVFVSSQLIQAKSVSSLWSKEFPVTGAGKTLKIGAALVVKAEIKASNGVLYLIDSVLPSE